MTPPARHRRRARRTAVDLPEGQIPTSTGTVELLRDRHAPGSVTVLVNGVPSSFHDLDDARWLEFEYMQHMAAVIENVTAGPLSVVHLGAGACTLPRWVDAARPGSVQLAVDIDAELVRLVREWFDLPRSPALRIRVGDAREALESMADSSADVVVRDVFAGARTPANLGTTQFLEQVARVLRPGGVYLANCADRPPLLLARAEAATVRAVFAEAGVVAEPGQFKGRRHGNLVIVGRDGPSLDTAGVHRDLRSLAAPARLLHGSELRSFVAGARALHDDD